MKFARGVSPRVLAIVSVALLVIFVFSSSRSLAATTYQVKVGGEVMGSPLAKGGMVWYNGYEPATIVIHPGDTVVWNVTGGVHTVTSAALAADGSFRFDSSRLITPADVLADMGPGKLLPPGSIFDLDTSTLQPGKYTYFCKIHPPGMTGTLNITLGPPGPMVNVVAGWGDHLYAVQAFAPQNVTITRGTIVRWTLMNPMEPHTITGVNATGAPAWDSSPDFNPTGPPPVLLLGQSFSYTFSDAGTFVYFCKLHAYKVGASWVGMTGTVIVVPDPAGLAPLGYGSLGLAIVALVAAIYGLVRKRGPAGPSPPQQ